MLRRFLALAALGVGTVGSAAACASSGPVAAPTTTVTTKPSETTTTALVTPLSVGTSAAPASSASTAPPTVGATGLPPCRPDMGSALDPERFDLGGSKALRPPDGFTPPAQDGFDWNEDGRPDRLIVDRGTGDRQVDVRPLLPIPNARVEPLWDIDGDGVADYAAVGVLERTYGGTVYYRGQGCTT